MASIELWQRRQVYQKNADKSSLTGWGELSLCGMRDGSVIRNAAPSDVQTIENRGRDVSVWLAAIDARVAHVWSIAGNHRTSRPGIDMLSADVVMPSRLREIQLSRTGQS